MKSKIIKLVDENFELIKSNKIEFEIESLNECFNDEIINENELKSEIENVKNIFNNCNSSEELAIQISIRDFDEIIFEDELFENIEALLY